MRHDGVEVKVTYEGDQLADAMDVLDLDDDSSLTIWFYDDITPGVRSPLLDAGVVIRVRDRGDDSDATVKLRPCRASQLVDPWPTTEATDALEFGVEEDWAGERRVLAASARAPLTPAEVARVRALQPPPAGLLSAQQIDYLADCAPIRVNTAGVAALGPIEANRWKSVDNDGLRDLDVRAERWRVPGLEFLELSIKVKEHENAEAAQRALESTLTALGLPPIRSQDTKTRRVLERLAFALTSGDPPTAAGADLSGVAVFFDIGDTLAAVTVSPGGNSITRLAVHPQVPHLLGTLRDRGARIGIISNRGSIPAADVDEALRDAGLMDFLDPRLIVYGPKDTTLVFEQAAALAGDRTRRVYVGEDAAERTQAARAGYLVTPHPELALAVLAPFPP
jgi:phosphoglycolate phosphatase-like HAD superfamily hydrolase